MDRRTFLKLAAMGSLSFAAGCSAQPDRTLFSRVQAPDDRITGQGLWYASTCRECPAGCGILAKNREGRAIKLEGNPLHPVNAGTLCMRGQAALQGVYNPDRLSTPLIKKEGRFVPLSYEDALAVIREKAAEAARKGPDRVTLVTEMAGPVLLSLFETLLKRWRSRSPVVFEPFAYESLKLASSQVFGVRGLVSYRMEKADLLVSFGADFLETWLSPVEYARRFKQMHAPGPGEQGLYLHVGPYAGLTAANADRFMPCRCEGEAFVALGLLREVLERRAASVPWDVGGPLKRILAPYHREAVLKMSGIRKAHYDLLLTRLESARKPLILGSSGAGENSPATDAAVCLLNTLLDPDLALIDFVHRHAVERAARRREVLKAFRRQTDGGARVLLLNNVDPVFSMPPGTGLQAILQQGSLFVVSFSSFMTETAALSDLIVPVAHPLESWDVYESKSGIWSFIQPVMGNLNRTRPLGDLIASLALEGRAAREGYRAHLIRELEKWGVIRDEAQWVQAVQKGGVFDLRLPEGARAATSPDLRPSWSWAGTLASAADPGASGTFLAAAPSIRLLDGRGANKPWLNEAPEPVTQVAWQTPVLMAPETAARKGIHPGDILKLGTAWGELEAPAYLNPLQHPDLLVVGIGQGHRAYGRYAEGLGVNVTDLLPPGVHPLCGGPLYRASPVSFALTGKRSKLAATDGSRIQHHRKIALTVKAGAVQPVDKGQGAHGLGMEAFPLALPLPEGYDPERDFYGPHDHDGYRWAMVIDLDRCIGCGACAVACYAENNIGVVGERGILEGREMAWLRIERYFDETDPMRVLFLPMLCQHCDNAPCESVCPVYAPHHSKEGLNNQIYNRCIGTRFCSQNCPYKVRRFNWFDWPWPAPLNLQLNPDVTVRSKGVMEKCSFCVQRIKAAHQKAKDEDRMIRDQEVVPACAQTCPAHAVVFGNLMDKASRVRRLAADPRAYQVMGYLNTKPAVFYLKKVIRDV